MKMPADRLHHMVVVVTDVRDAASRMARIYGITEWQVADSSGHVSDQIIHGHRIPYGFRSATGSAVTESGPVTFQLVQPIHGWSTYHEFLLTRGEGVMGMCIAETTAGEFDRLLPWLADNSVPVAQSYCIDGVVHCYQLDTRKTLGGFYVELVVPAALDWREKLKPDETWDLSDQVPLGGPLMPISSFRHFGVVVHDLMQTVQQWHRLLGCTNFNFMNWHNAPDSLVNPINNGQSVNHAYFTTTPTIGTMLSFELIQPTFGPSHYKEDFLRQVGEGVHHLFTAKAEDRVHWEQIERRMAAIDAPVCMGGGLGNDLATFYYLDTRRALPGYVTELFFTGKNWPAISTPGPRFKPAMTVDLATVDTP